MASQPSQVPRLIDSRTAWDGRSKVTRAYARGFHHCQYTYRQFPRGAKGLGKCRPKRPNRPAGELLPFLTAGGDLSIPFDSPERYHWWRGGQSVAETLAEVKERMKNAIAV